MVSEDIDFLRRDLWDTIAAGDAPEWRLEMQIMPFEEAAEYRLRVGWGRHLLGRRLPESRLCWPLLR
jgi:Catalase